MMRFGNPARLVAALGLALLLTAPALHAAAQKDKDNKDKDASTGKSVTFKTVDGVEIGGTYWEPEKGAKTNKDVTVLLLHDFSKAKGGDSHQDDMDKLGDQLNDQGYAVLSFDFRGFGRSKDISPDQFWANPTNKLVLPPGFNPRSPATSIDAKSFPAAYFLHLVDDVTAAKAYLDRKSMDKKLNSSQLVVIGAGQGATVGMMWVYGQHHLFRQKGQKGTALQPLPDLDEAEGKDVIGTFWLAMSPSIEGVTIPIKAYMEDMEKKYKTPMVFLYGDGDKAAETQALAWLRSVMPDYKQMGAKGIFNDANKQLKYTRDYALTETKLTGGKLYTGDLNTGKVIQSYLDEYLKDRPGTREPRRIEVEKFPYYYVPLNATSVRQYLPAKVVNEENMQPMPLRVLHLGQ